MLLAEDGTAILAEDGTTIGTDGVFVDNFARSNRVAVAGPLGNGWTDLGSVLPDSYDRAGILGGNVVPLALTRSALTGTPWAPDPAIYDFDDYPGTIIPGIFGGYRQTGSTAVSVSVRWSGLWDVPTGKHVEATPALHFVPGSDECCIGAWPVYYEGIAVLFVAAVGDPPEVPDLFDTAVFAHTEGTPRTIGVVSNGTEFTVWLDGAQVSLQSAGLSPLAVPAALQGSTLHGFMVDQHRTAYADGAPSLANMQAAPALSSIEIIGGQ